MVIGDWTLGISARLFTVPYFFVRSFRYTTSYRHGYLGFQMYLGGGRGDYSSRRRGRGEKNRGSLYFCRFLPNRPRPLSSFDTHARWQPVTQSARSRWSYGKIEDCNQSIFGHTCTRNNAMTYLSDHQTIASQCRKQPLLNQLYSILLNF